MLQAGPSSLHILPKTHWHSIHTTAILCKGGLKPRKPKHGIKSGRRIKVPAKSIDNHFSPSPGQRAGRLITAPGPSFEHDDSQQSSTIIHHRSKRSGFGIMRGVNSVDSDIPEEFKDFYPEQNTRQYQARERLTQKTGFNSYRAPKQSDRLRVFRVPSLDERKNHPDDASDLIAPVDALHPSFSLNASRPSTLQRLKIFKNVERLRISAKAYDERTARQRDLSEKTVARGEFVTPPPSPDHKSNLSKTFNVPGLLPGLYRSVVSLLSPFASGDGKGESDQIIPEKLEPKTTPIQGLALKHILGAPGDYQGQWLLASETGSGKSLAYMLPILNGLKETEREAISLTKNHGPRAIVLAPTHELARQLAANAKALSHNVKLRVVCQSKPNRQLKTRPSARMAAGVSDAVVDGLHISDGAFGRMVDVLTGTPMSILDAVRGKGWNWAWRAENEKRGVVFSEDGKLQQTPKGVELYKGWVDQPSVKLEDVEWVVVDEADVLFDKEFVETTVGLLSDIAAAKGSPVSQTSADPITYPFNLILTSATIPASLSHYLSTRHPCLTRLASPRLHRLPISLKTEHVAWSGSNKNADIEARLRRVWEEDAMKSSGQRLSKVLIFCNKRTRVHELKTFLERRDIRCVGLTGGKDDTIRQRGSNRHLDGFLRTQEPPEISGKAIENPITSPHVLITTSLLSRGLDFSPLVKHVFIVDEPRNMLDFLHRAGRSGRAGHKGNVVLFGHASGRGSESSREARKIIARMS